MRNKKGALELGINAIVVLIIALAILGLAIGFITKLIGQSQTKFEGLIDSSELPVHADPDKPLVFDPPTVKVKALKTGEITVVVYNSLTTDATVELSIPDPCVDDKGITLGNAGDLYIVSSPKTVKSGVEGGFKALIRAGDIGGGTYICTVKADIISTTSGDNDQLYQQIFVNVYR